jgi:hypothetical protein
MNLYLRREPTVDSVLVGAIKSPHTDEYERKKLLKAWRSKGQMDVVYYRDPQATQKLCRDVCPRRIRKDKKTVMYNCARYKAVWLPDLPHPDAPP